MTAPELARIAKAEKHIRDAIQQLDPLPDQVFGSLLTQLASIAWTLAEVYGKGEA